MARSIYGSITNSCLKLKYVFSLRELGFGVMMKVSKAARSASIASRQLKALAWLGWYSVIEIESLNEEERSIAG